MNAKKAKCLRRMLRAEGIDPTNVTYEVLDRGGFWRSKVIAAVPHEKCGHSLYRRAKRHFS